MVKPDLILTWPCDCDYPLWRIELQRWRSRVGRVLVVLTNRHVGDDLSAHVVAELERDGVELFTSPTPRAADDWRDVAVNHALDASTSDWVWFGEQDLRIIAHGPFWRTIDRLLPVSLGMGWRDASVGRWHPAILLVDRNAVELTGRYFGPDPRDHFWTFSNEVDNLGRIADLGEFLTFGGFSETSMRGWAQVTHMAGLSHNHQLIDEGRHAEVYQPHEMEIYLRACLQCGAVLDPRWEASARSFLLWRDTIKLGPWA